MKSRIFTSVQRELKSEPVTERANITPSIENTVNEETNEKHP